jgi:hypothetical protein
MTHSSPVRTLVEVTSAALVLGASLACAGPTTAPARSPSATSQTRSPGAEPSADRATSQPSPAAAAPQTDETADNVVTLIAKPGLWPLDVEAARRVLQAFGPVNREQRSPNDLSLVGGPYGALDRFDIAYSLDDKQYWVFGSAGFFLDDRDPARLYHTLEARLTQLLGKPAHTEHDEGETESARLPPVVWDLGEAWLSLAQSTDHGQDVVLIAIRENEQYSE